MVFYAFTDAVLILLLILFGVIFAVAYSAERDNTNIREKGIIDLRISVLVLVWNTVFFILLSVAVLMSDDPEFVMMWLPIGGSMLGAANFGNLGQTFARISEQ